MFIRTFGDLYPYVDCKKIIDNSNLKKKKTHAWHVPRQSFFWNSNLLHSNKMNNLCSSNWNHGQSTFFCGYFKFTQSNKYIIVSFTISFMHIVFICLYNVYYFYLHPTNMKIIKPLNKLFMPHCLYYWI